MSELKVGDIVARKSYGFDVFFKVVDIRNDGHENIVTLKGISYRIQADAPESDLILQPDQKVREYTRSINTMVERKVKDIYASGQRSRSKKAFYRNTPKDDTRTFKRPGRVLHIDGDQDYLDTCLEEYRKLGIEAVGKYIPESEQPNSIYPLLEQNKPDILVLTGHDGVLKGTDSYLSISNYRNSRYFIEAVKKARDYNKDLDSLVIFAGACQSMYKEIIKAGANFASAPYRVLIHALDPVFICQKVAFTGIDRILAPSDVINTTITGSKGIGGLQTRGKYRDGFPSEPYNE